MRLQKVEVEGLFGIYDYSINLFTGDNITIIDAPNGMGKTTVLKLIKASVEGELTVLDSIPFKRFRLEFDNEQIIEVQKKDIFKSIFDIDLVRLRNTVTHCDNQEHLFDNIVYLINSEKYTFSLQRDFVMMFTRRYMTPRGMGVSGEYVDRHKLIDLLEEDKLLRNDIFEAEELYEALRKYTKSLNIYFIKANRLYKNPTEQMGRRRGMEHKEAISSVALYRNELKEMIMSAGRKYADESEKLDRTFPKRVIEGILCEREIEVYEFEQINSMLRELETNRSELATLGLITESADSLINIPDKNELTRETRIFLSNYIDDNIIKLDIYKDLAHKLDVLRDIVNERNGFSDKEMRFSAKEGVIFRTKSGKEIPIEKLSSGEKNNFVLFYELIFKCARHSLILVDEPEISLHVSWQQEFVNELIEICNMKGMQGIVATHSPSIVHNHWDLLVDLEGDDTNEE